jgi:type II secretory pathway pseudopilin PulG
VGAEGGFGLVELVIAMVVLTVAITVLVASFSSATVAINRAARISTAGVVADSQMERYRAMTYAWIGLDTAVATDAAYTSDVACVGGAGCSNDAPTIGASSCRAGGTVYTSFPTNCVPTTTTTGPDGRSYRLDTYVRAIQSVVVGNPRSTKLITVVVRDTGAGNKVLAREESIFDYCTALPDPSGTGAAC